MTKGSPAGSDNRSGLLPANTLPRGIAEMNLSAEVQAAMPDGSEGEVSAPLQCLK